MFSPFFVYLGWIPGWVSSCLCQQNACAQHSALRLCDACAFRPPAWWWRNGLETRHWRLKIWEVFINYLSGVLSVQYSDENNMLDLLESLKLTLTRTQTVQGGGWASSKGGDLQIDSWQTWFLPVPQVAPSLKEPVKNGRCLAPFQSLDADQKSNTCLSNCPFCICSKYIQLLCHNLLHR